MSVNSKLTGPPILYIMEGGRQNAMQKTEARRWRYIVTLKGRTQIWVSLILRVSHVYQFVLAMIMNIELNPPHFEFFLM